MTARWLVSHKRKSATRGGGFLLADGEAFFRRAPTDAGLNLVDLCDAAQALGGDLGTILLINVVQLAPGASTARLHFHARLEDAVGQADFVQENGPERLDFKVDLLRRIDEAAPSHAILASSSSGLSVTAMQAQCKHPERVVLGHPFNPPHMIPLVEVGGGEKTSAQAITTAMDFYTAIGKRPIHVRREIKGHIANRLQAALWREAFHLVHEGVASVSDIDTAIAHGPGLRWALMGPFMNLHLSGGEGGIAHLLAHLGGPIEDWWQDLGAPQMTPALQSRVADGVTQALGGRTSAELVAARDALLVDLLRAKQDARVLD